MSTVVDCLVIWGLVQVLVIWCCARIQEVRNERLQRYLASPAAAWDRLEIERRVTSAGERRIPRRTSDPPSRSGRGALSTSVSVGKSH